MVNYSRIIGRVARLMQSPSVIDSPSGGVPEKASKWDLLRTETSGGGKSISWTPLLVSRFSEFIVVELGQKRQRRAHEAPGHAFPLGVPWWLMATSWGFWPSPEASSVGYV